MNDYFIFGFALLLSGTVYTWVWLSFLVIGFISAWILVDLGSKRYLQTCAVVMLAGVALIVSAGEDFATALVLSMGTGIALFLPIYFASFFNHRIALFVVSVINPAFAAIVLVALTLRMTFTGV